MSPQGFPPSVLMGGRSLLPPPPPGKSGWPWTEEGERLPDAMPDGRPWPRITIVTPSYNQADYLEETLRSVLLQSYPNLEYIVIDGGSSDGSVAILRRYGPWLSHWASEPDRGQSHAINKGFARATGDIFAWLNSDDVYYPGALRMAAETLAGHSLRLVVGAMDKVERTSDDRGLRPVRRSSPSSGAPLQQYTILKRGRRAEFHFIQPPMFWTRDLWERTGGLDERYHYVMDMEWCNRALAADAEVLTTEAVISRFLLHEGSKSQEEMDRMRMEEALMYWRLGRSREFRLVPCLLSALLPIQRTLSLRAVRSREAGQGLRAGFLLGAARSAKLLRLLAGQSGARAGSQDGARA